MPVARSYCAVPSVVLFIKQMRVLLRVCTNAWARCVSFLVCVCSGGDVRGAATIRRQRIDPPREAATMYLHANADKSFLLAPFFLMLSACKWAPSCKVDPAKPRGRSVRFRRPLRSRPISGAGAVRDRKRDRCELFCSLLDRTAGIDHLRTTWRPLPLITALLHFSHLIFFFLSRTLIGRHSGADFALFTSATPTAIWRCFFAMPAGNKEKRTRCNGKTRQ